jgi:hypothetical protein
MYAMQTPLPDQLTGAALFSRERRRQRMLQFLEMFERRSWRCEPELPYLLPFSKTDLRDAALSSREQKAS